jgi:hypothetical protein
VNDLPQSSVLSPFLFNLPRSDMDKFVLSGCNFFQYADEFVVTSSHLTSGIQMQITRYQSTF